MACFRQSSWQVPPFQRKVLLRLSVAVILFGSEMKCLRRYSYLPFALPLSHGRPRNPTSPVIMLPSRRKVTKRSRHLCVSSRPNRPVEVTRIYGDKSLTNRFPLDGSEGDYTTETGVRGKCRAQLKDNTLVLESLVASPPNANTPSLRFDTIEEWRLSADTKTLTVKTQIKSPDMPPDVMAAAFPNNPRTEKYQRLDAR